MDNYTAIPNELFWDLQSGKINNRQFNILLWLRYRAGYKTGITKQACAERIKFEMFGGDEGRNSINVRTIQRELNRLHKMGYITSHHVEGRRGSYQITVNNYLSQRKDKDGTVREVLLNPKETTAWHELNESSVADDEATVVADTSGDRDGDSDGDTPAYTLLPLRSTTSTTIQKPELVSGFVGKVVATAPPTLAAAAAAGNDDDGGCSSFSNGVILDEGKKPSDLPQCDMPIPSEDEQQIVLDLSRAFGMEFFDSVKYAPAVRSIYAAMILRSDTFDLRGLIQFAQQHKFWKTRIVNIEALAKAMHNLEPSGLIQQYTVFLNKPRPKSKVDRLNIEAQKDTEGMVHTLDKGGISRPMKAKRAELAEAYGAKSFDDLTAEEEAFIDGEEVATVSKSFDIDDDETGVPESAFDFDSRARSAGRL